MDSKLVVEQMSGRWQIKHPGLRPLAASAATLVQRFRTVRFTWIPRAENAHADRLANLAMDGVEPDSSVPLPSPSPSPFGAGPGSWEPPTLAEPLRMLLVRHGETAMTAQKRYSGRGDVPLSPTGETQAKAVAMRVYQLAPALDAVITSPLRRCRSTARALAGGAPVHVEDDLIECDFGAWEGLTFAEVRSRYAPAAAVQRKNHRHRQPCDATEDDPPRRPGRRRRILAPVFPGRGRPVHRRFVARRRSGRPRHQRDRPPEPSRRLTACGMG
jgi:hypothetical protein